MTKFDPSKKEHKLICLAAMAAADALGVGRITACKEQLGMEDIQAYSTRAEQDTFQRAVMEWGREV